MYNFFYGICKQCSRIVIAFDDDSTSRFICHLSSVYSGNEISRLAISTFTPILLLRRIQMPRFYLWKNRNSDAHTGWPLTAVSLLFRRVMVMAIQLDSIYRALIITCTQRLCEREIADQCCRITASIFGVSYEYWTDR